MFSHLSTTACAMRGSVRSCPPVPTPTGPLQSPRTAPRLWCGQVIVEIFDHQQRGPTGPLDGGSDNILYGQGVIWGQVTPHNIPLLQLEADNVRPIGMGRFYGEVLRLPVEDGNAAAADVCARRLRRHHLVSTRPTRIYTYCEISVLEYSQVHVGLII